MKPFLAIPIILALVHRAWSRKSLTPLGILAAVFTAVAHAVHPWSLPLILLVVFYLGGTSATKVKHDVKARLTVSATGSAGGEGQRTHTQVLANSITATMLSLLHTWALTKTTENATQCYSNGHNPADLFVVGIVANYAAVAGDTFSSELGILSKSKPRLITSLTLRVVPPGTNGGVTGAGLLAGLLGAFTIGLTTAILLPFCSEGDDIMTMVKVRAQWILATSVWGCLGSILDSVLGGLLQASVVDKRTGKVVEGTGGQKVLVHPSSTKPGATADTSGFSASSKGGVQLRNMEAVANTATLKGTDITGTSVGMSPGMTTDQSAHESRRVESGSDILDNNQVNVLMAVLMSIGAIGVASWIWDLSIFDVEAVRDLIHF